jgi:hypothetical protein
MSDMFNIFHKYLIYIYRDIILQENPYQGPGLARDPHTWTLGLDHGQEASKSSGRSRASMLI